MNKLLNAILKLANSIIPKNKKKIIFISKPDYSDNAKSFYEFVEKKSNHSIIWIVEDLEKLDELNSQGIKTYKNYSINAIFSIITSKYIVSTHNHFLSIKSKNQKYIALWHGMPLKTIYFLEKDYDKNLKFIDYTISTSNIMRLAISASFNLDPRKVLITGQPRNDYLFNSKIDINNLINSHKHKYNKILLYLPTYRSGVGRNEGVSNYKNIVNIQEYEENNLNEFLKKNNYLLITKLHPAEEGKFKTEEYSNIKLLNTKQFNNKKISLNEILNSVDLLITDYSSVYFDYLILNRPILFTNMDEKEYMRDRGIIFDNPDFWRPGPKVRNIENFTKEIETLFNDSNYYRKEREEVNSLVNIYKDDKSSERIFNSIFKV